MRLVLVAVSLALSLGLVEAGLRLLPPRSQDFLPTLGSQRWMERYWKPINRIGVRDRDWDPRALAETRTLLVLGDSFAAGSGIRDVDDRLSGVLQRSLGSEWSVPTLAEPGWDTGQELLALERGAYRPDAVALLYFVNDVLGAAGRHGFGFDMDAHLRVRPAWLEPLVSHSYLVNLVYWRSWRRIHQEELARDYRELLDASFFRHDVWQEHAQELRGIVRYARRNDASLVVLVIPILVDVEGSRKYTSRVVQVFENEGVPVIDLAARLAGRDFDELIVSREDHHANERLHAEMAGLIYEALHPLELAR